VRAWWGRVAVRVRVKLKSLEEESWIETSALINSGYEADKPEVVIPLALARSLNLSLSGATLEERATPIGSGELRYLGEALELKVSCEERETKAYRVHVLVSEYEHEILISDYLAGELGIAVEDLREGLISSFNMDGFKWT
jgi:hypothetical protein